MDAKLPKRKQYKTNAPYKPYKSRAKPYWTSELQDLWNEAWKQESIWLAKRRHVKSWSLREDFHTARQRFDKLNRQCLRKYKVEQQKSHKKLQDDFENFENPRNFCLKLDSQVQLMTDKPRFRAKSKPMMAK